ncbi:MAG TPA: SCO family protein [Tepidisphaeraceae bacterium]|jgi:protein SCO1/2|nr:SCO family protein [Tepidisphaeraceae bacterium]
MSQIPDQTSAIPAHDRPGAASPARMSKTQKLINFALWGVLGVVLLGMLVGKFMPAGHPPMKVLFHAAAFTLTDQDARPFSGADLRGKAYVCDFIFTTCGSACPMMSHKLQGIQTQTPAALQLVSFTVNPEHDTPPVLKEYAVAYGADFSRWHFLTGTPAQMSALVRGMNFAVTPATDHDPIGHSEKFLLIDGDGNVRGIYDSADGISMKDLIADATWLATTPGGRGW